MSSFTIGKKLFLSVGALLALMFTMGITAFLSIGNIGDRLHTATGPTLKKLALSNRLAIDSAEAIGDERAVIVRGYSKELDKAEGYNAAANASFDDMQAALKDLLAISTRPAAKQAVQDFDATLSPMRESSNAIMAAVKGGDMASAFKALDSGTIPNSKKQHEVVQRLAQIEEELSASDNAAAEKSIIGSRLITGLVLLLAVLLGAIVVFVVRGINKVLRNTILDLGNSSGQIASAATQVSGASQSLAQGASEQAATIEETSSASSEINSMAQRNTENSRSATEVVSRSQDRVGHTGRSLDEMVVAMDGITASSQKISKIIKVIDEIAFQTNILALNAAVEAARAGDAGLGFAVVADEVRNLAQRSAQAAKDTSSLIEESIRQSSGGKAKVDRVAEEFKAISDESSKMKTLIDEISLGSVEQSRGIDQISRSIAQIEQVVQSSAANAEETASAAEELQSQAQAMREVVETLARMVDGNGVAQDTRTVHTHNGASNRKTPIKAVAARQPNRISPARLATAGPAAFPMDDEFKEF